MPKMLQLRIYGFCIYFTSLCDRSCRNSGTTLEQRFTRCFNYMGRVKHWKPRVAAPGEWRPDKDTDGDSAGRANDAYESGGWAMGRERPRRTARGQAPLQTNDRDSVLSE